MTTIADVNVLFPILFEDHAHHVTAWRWWTQQADQSVGLCLLTRMGSLRLLTNTKAMGGAPVTPERAMEAWDTLADDPRCVWLEAESQHDSYLRSFIKGRQPSPNLWTDAWLAALAASSGFHLTSFDSDFRSFKLPHFEHLIP